MYISKVILDRRAPSIWQCLSNCQDMHRNIMKMFESSRKEAGVLYRMYLKNSEASVYVLSQIEPINAELPHGMKLIGTKEISSLINTFNKGECFAFDLLAAPSKKIDIENKKNSRRRALQTQEERLEWLNSKAASGGFIINSVQECGKERYYGTHNAENGGKMVIDAIHFQGSLCIDDRDKFVSMYKSGIGPGKAYGLGMILLMRRQVHNG